MDSLEVIFVNFHAVNLAVTFNYFKQRPALPATARVPLMDLQVGDPIQLLSRPLLSSQNGLVCVRQKRVH